MCIRFAYGQVGLDSPSVQQVKRVLKSGAVDDAAGGRRNLHLEDAPPRMRLEVQAYMSLYYDTRIQSAVVKRWAETHISNMDFSGGAEEIPKDQIDPEDSSLLKDLAVPLFFKNLVTRELYVQEEESIKDTVQSKLKADSKLLIKTVYNTTDEEAQSELLQEYQR